MNFDSAFYSEKFPDAAADPSLHYLTEGWKQGLPPNADNTPLTPDELLQMISASGPNLGKIAAGLSTVQLDYLDQATNFDLGAVLASLDGAQLADFMAGWGKEELAYVDALETFDLSQTVGKLAPNVLMGLLDNWEGEANLELLANGSSFDFGVLKGASPDTVMAYIGKLNPTLQLAIYDDFDASAFAWLDGATDFDLAATLKTDFAFFKQIMNPDETLGLFANLGDKLSDIASSLNAQDLQFLDSAVGLDLGNLLGTVDDATLAGFMKGWGADELAYLNTLTGFNLAGEVGGFDPDLLSSMISGWKDPNTLYFLNDLEGSGFGAKLGQMPASLVANLASAVDDNMLVALQGISGNFDMGSMMTGG